MKKTTKNKQKLEFFVSEIVFFISLFGLIIGFYIFGVGFHNMDLGQNMRYLEASLDIDLIDQANNFKYYESSDIYINGTNQMTLSIWIIFASALILGASIQYFLDKAYKEIER